MSEITKLTEEIRALSKLVALTPEDDPEFKPLFAQLEEKVELLGKLLIRKN